MCHTPVFGTRQEINKELSVTAGKNFTMLFEFWPLFKMFFYFLFSFQGICCHLALTSPNCILRDIVDGAMKGRKIPVMTWEGWRQLQELQWGRNELCGHLSLRCLLNIQVEIPKRQLDTLGWHLRQRSKLHK